MSAQSTQAGYSIAAVSKLTGVSCHALRVWERRYGYPVPERSPSGHRRYSQEQVGVLRQLARLAHSGRAIGELIGEYLAGSLRIRGDEALPAGEKPACSPVVDRLFEGDMVSADELIDRLGERLTASELVERVIEPALVDIGERWFRGEAEIFQERCATASLLARLGRMLYLARRSNARPSRSVLVGAVKGDNHEGGVLMVSLALELSGLRAVTLGCDIPVEEYQKAIDAWHPDALALSFVLSRNINKRFRELSKIKSVPIFVGGRSIVNHQGLARRHGLFPLTGSLRACTTQLINELERMRRRQAQATLEAPG